MIAQQPAALPEYLGWTNKATWLVMQRINTTPTLRAEAERICADALLDRSIAADNLREWVESLARDNSEGLERDLCLFAASLCDWRQIARDICDELIDHAASDAVDQQMAAWDRDGLYREL